MCVCVCVSLSLSLSVFVCVCVSLSVVSLYLSHTDQGNRPVVEVGVKFIAFYPHHVISPPSHQHQPWDYTFPGGALITINYAYICKPHLAGKVRFRTFFVSVSVGAARDPGGFSQGYVGQ